MMSYYPDLNRHVAGVQGDAVRAVGWLSRDHAYPRARASTAFIAALKMLRSGRAEIFRVLEWWPAFAGPHECELCTGHLESGEIAVPAEDLVFEAPSMIVHYVEQHEYRPPAEFVRAAMSCPEPSSRRYAEAIAFAARADEAGVARVRWYPSTQR